MTTPTSKTRAGSRIGEYDLPARFASYLPPLATMVLFGLFWVVVVILVRLVLSFSIGGAGPYSLIYPAILISTLFGRWQAGLICFVLSFLYSWYYILPYPGSFEFELAQDAPRTLVNGSAALVIVIFAETFRRAVQRAVAERDIELAARELLLKELDHRTKNNFAMVASLLDMQRRQQVSEEAQGVLTIAAARVQSFAALHTSLYSGRAFIEEVSMCHYLTSLQDDLQSALFEDERIKITLDCQELMMPRDRALAIGLVMNEIVTNAAKHAFSNADTGLIAIDFAATSEDEWTLTITDDGHGMAESTGDTGSGLGSRLIEAFTRKAGARLNVERLERGTRFTLTAE